MNELNDPFFEEQDFSKTSFFKECNNLSYNSNKSSFIQKKKRKYVRKKVRKMVDLADVPDFPDYVPEDLVPKKSHNKKGKFEFHSKNVFGTYSRCPISKESVMQFLINLGAIKCIVCEEMHAEKKENQSDKHVHFWATFDKPIRTVSPFFFDYCDKDKTYHCCFGTPRSKVRTIRYVRKDGDFCEYGFKSQDYLKCAQDHDAEVCEDLIKEKITMVELVNKYPEYLLKLASIQKNFWLYKNMEAYENLKKQRKGKVRIRNVDCFWLYGEPGIGKTFLINKRFPNAYRKANNKWWDDYVNQKVVIFEDFDNPYLKHDLKIWADKYDFYGEIKGATIVMVYNVLIITSNYTIDELWKMEEPNDDEKENSAYRKKYYINEEFIKAIKRRFKVFHLVPGPNKKIEKIPDEINDLPYDEEFKIYPDNKSDDSISVSEKNSLFEIDSDLFFD